jgi:hypothetical protein
MHDSVKDLFPAVRACTIEEWRTEFAAYNGLRFIGNADGVLSNMCFSAEIEQTALCRAVQPSDAPVPTTTTANARLGTRATVLDYFDSLGFDGELSTLVTGEERWMGSNDDFSAEVIGPAGAVRQISVFMDLTPANEDDSRKFISQTLAEFVPGSADWAAQELSGAIRGTDSQREFGPVTVKLSGSVADTFTLVFVTMTHR